MELGLGPDLEHGDLFHHLRLDLKHAIGRGGCNKSRENPGIAKIGLTPPRDWLDKKRVNATRDN